MANAYLSEELEEAFFERYFEYGDDMETNVSNAKKALNILKIAYGTAEEITSAAENGECFDEAGAILAFQTLALAKLYLEQFIGSLTVTEQEPYRYAVAELLK